MSQNLTAEYYATTPRIYGAPVQALQASRRDFAAQPIVVVGFTAWTWMPGATGDHLHKLTVDREGRYVDHGHIF